MELQVEWANVKDFINNRNAPFFYVVGGNRYHIVAVDGAIELICLLPKVTSPDTDSEQYDFEQNYMSKASSKINPLDSDNAQLVRIKTNTSGWFFQDRYLNFSTSTLNSLHNAGPDGSDRGDANLKFYDANDVELTTQNDIDASCVKTVLDVEPPYDFEIIEGGCFVKEMPTTPVHVTVIMAPDVPAPNGNKCILSGADLSEQASYEIEGRSVKRLNYNATYHTNKLRAVVRHSAGVKLKINFDIDHFIE